MLTSHPGCRRLGNQTAFINKLPFEILTIIFFLLPPSTFENPYVYLRLSWVCHYWRAVLLSNPPFWNIVKHRGRSRKSVEFVQEIIRRSGSSKLDLFWCPCGSPLGYLIRLVSISCLSSYTSAQCPRIRTLFLRDLRDSLDGFLDYGLKEWPEFSFPQLESLILHPDLVNPVSYDKRKRNAFENLIATSRLRYLECPDTLFDERMPEIVPSLSQVEWLKITCLDEENVIFFHNLLQNLPNLRVLNMVNTEDYAYIDAIPTFTVKLPNLRMLSVDSSIWEGEICPIRAPALDSLSIFQSDSFEKDLVWDLLEGINLQMIKSISVQLRELNAYRNPNMIGGIGCISTGHSEEDCKLFYTFHHEIPKSHAASDHKYSLLPPKNSFHIELPWSANFDKLFHQLNRATNLVQLTVDFQSIKVDLDQSVFLGQLFRSLETVLHLTVSRSPSFVLICDLLGENMRLLERLTYHSSIRMIDPTFLPKRIKKIQSCRPLNILELKNCARSFSPACVAEIESLGIQFIYS